MASSLRRNCGWDHGDAPDGACGGGERHMTTTVPATYPATRGALHAVAEHVLAAALHRSTGRIGLRATPDGFGTPRFTVDGGGRQVPGRRHRSRRHARHGRAAD